MLLIFLILLCKIKGVLIKLRYQSSDYDPKGQYKRHGILCLQHCAYSFYSKLSKHAFTYIQLSKFSLFLSPKKKNFSLFGLNIYIQIHWIYGLFLFIYPPLSIIYWLLFHAHIFVVPQCGARSSKVSLTSLLA